MKLNKEKYNLLLAENCLTQAEIASMSKVGKGTIIKMLAGADTQPKTIGKIAKALKVDVLCLIEASKCI